MIPTTKAIQALFIRRVDFIRDLSIFLRSFEDKPMNLALNPPLNRKVLP